MRLVTIGEIRAATFRSSDVDRIMLLHPAMRWRVVDWLKQIRAGNLSVGISHTLRTWKEQEAIYAIGRAKRTDGSWYEVPGQKVVTWAKPGESWHNYGLALDFFLLLGGGKTASWDTGADYDRDGHADWTEIGEAGESVGLSWGMRWGGKKTDGDHFEFHPGLTLEQAWAMTIAKQPIPEDYFERAG